MKKIIFLAAMLLTAVSMNSANTITLGDTVRINPNRLSGYYQHPVAMTVDGMCNAWQIDLVYPDGMFPKLVAGIQPLDGLSVTYLDKNGEEQTYTPTLNVAVQYTSIAAYIPVAGYWLFAGDYESYGTAKWMPGTYDLFEFNFAVQPEFREGDVTITGAISSGRDDRGAILQNVRIYSVTHFWVGYDKGDVSGDDRINIADAVLLIDYLLNGEGLDEFQIAAADVDGDGTAGIADVAIIIDMMLIG